MLLHEIAEADLVLGKELGKGSFGAVYKGEWFGGAVVVKVRASQRRLRPSKSLRLVCRDDHAREFTHCHVR